MCSPREVYEQLRKEGYRVNYCRVPITDGASPSIALFDTFNNVVQGADEKDPMIFNCQMGGGRTTTGMVIACLIRAKMYGRFHLSLLHWKLTALSHRSLTRKAGKVERSLLFISNPCMFRIKVPHFENEDTTLVSP